MSMSKGAPGKLSGRRSTSAFRNSGPGLLNCPLAVSRASSDISTPVTTVPGSSSAILQAMHPEPVHRSSTLPPAGMRCTAHSTSSSVSGLGIRTEGLTLKRLPRNSWKPVTYCSGSPLLSRTKASISSGNLPSSISREGSTMCAYEGTPSTSLQRRLTMPAASRGP